MSKPKTKKQEEIKVEEVIPTETESIIEEPAEPTIDEVEEPVAEEPEPTIEPVYIPEIPAQMDEVVSPIVVEEKPESDEVLFLQNILQIQRNGGFGRHLDGIINDRIKTLKGK